MFSVIGEPEGRTILAGEHADGVFRQNQFSVSVPAPLWGTPGAGNILDMKKFCLTVNTLECL